MLAQRPPVHDVRDTVDEYYNTFPDVPTSDIILPVKVNTDTSVKVAEKDPVITINNVTNIESQLDTLYESNNELSHIYPPIPVYNPILVQESRTDHADTDGSSQPLLAADPHTTDMYEVVEGYAPSAPPAPHMEYYSMTGHAAVGHAPIHGHSHAQQDSATGSEVRTLKYVVCATCRQMMRVPSAAVLVHCPQCDAVTNYSPNTTEL